MLHLMKKLKSQLIVIITHKEYAGSYLFFVNILNDVGIGADIITMPGFSRTPSLLCLKSGAAAGAYCSTLATRMF